MSTRWFRRTLISAGVLVGLMPGVMTSQAGASEVAAQDVGAASCFSPTPHSFTDVGPEDAYDTAVSWLVEAGITSGTGPGLYSPAAVVPRGQMAQFLWRAADSPAPVVPHGFTDVPATAFYNDAVSWLVENHITAGTTPTTFGPNGLVTRGQMAQFLWRAAGSPPPQSSHGFTDVPPTAYYNDAVSWLVENNITVGTTETTFSPNDLVTRGQMALFLWRDTCGPEPVAPSQFAAGAEHMCAITDGTVSCWGKNDAGQLGNTTYTPNPTPTPVAGLTNVTAIAAGRSHTCAVTGGTVSCWGDNDAGQLGNTTNIGSGDPFPTPNPTPTPVAGLTNVTNITAGGEHTCAVAEGTVSCWGNNRYGQLGNTTNNVTSNPNPTPTPVAGLTNVTNITAGAEHTCAVAEGTVSCWGNNRYGQLGNTTNSGNGNPNPTPTPVNGLGAVTAVTAGFEHTCAVAEGTVSCWGNNYHGQLGNTTNSGNGNPNPTPTPVTGITNVISVTAGFSHTCATADGIVSCWGYNNFGQLGNTTNNGNGNPNPTPTPVNGLAAVTNVTAGDNHTCAAVDATMSCWGLNNSGQLGNTTNIGSVNANPTPTPVAGLG